MALPYLRVANVQDGYLDLAEIKTICVRPERVERYRLQVGDVLLTEGGDFDKLGRGAVWLGEIENCLHQNHVFAVRPYKRHLLSSYLSALAGSDYGRKYFLSCSKQTTNLASINSTQLKAFPLLLPPLAEQKTIADLLSAWGEAIEKTEQLIAEKEAQYTAQLSMRLSAGRRNFVRLKSFLTEVAERNRTLSVDRVLSVTNSNGFVRPEDHFDRQVASENLSNYKIVSKGQYAYNPSRINVGSIARLDKWDQAVLSPMYIVFRINEGSFLNTDIFLHWLKSRETRQRIRLSAQGSVRNSVSFADFCAIGFPDIKPQEQAVLADYFNALLLEIERLRLLVVKYRDQKRGLMQRVLTGEWRVRADVVRCFAGGETHE